MRGREIAEKLGVTHQRVHQLAIRLHAQGRVTFGDPEKPLRIVMRADDKTPVLSLEEERVLSAIPPEYATNATKIRLAARMPEKKVQQILERLIASLFVKACEGFQGNQLYPDHRSWLETSPTRPIRLSRASAPPSCGIGPYSQSAFGHSGLGGAADQRRHGCLKSAAPIDKCPHAVSQAKAFDEKNRSGVQLAVCVDGRRACSLGGNDTTTCRIDPILLPHQWRVRMISDCRAYDRNRPLEEERQLCQLIEQR
jgi:hypothetical protein